jgi:hypothetical protein
MVPPNEGNSATLFFRRVPAKETRILGGVLVAEFASLAVVYYWSNKLKEVPCASDETE